MNNEGWIKIYYKIREWEWYGDPNMVALWLHLLISANWKDRKWHGVDIKRGQFVTSVTKLAEATGLTPRQTRVCLERLQNSKQIDKQTTSHYTIITICNFDNYQDCVQAEWQTNDKQDVNQMANQWQTNDKQDVNQMATTEEYKEGNKLIIQEEKNINTPTPACAREENFDLETYGIMQNVKMKPSQYRHLVESYGEETAKEVIDAFSCKLADGSTDSANHFATIVSWLGYRRRMGSGSVPLSSTATKQSHAAMPPPPPPQEERELSPDEQAIIEEWQAFTSEWREEKEKYAKLNEIAQRHGGIAPDVLTKLGMMQWKDKWIFK